MQGSVGARTVTPALDQHEDNGAMSTTPTFLEEPGGTFCRCGYAGEENDDDVYSMRKVGSDGAQYRLRRRGALVAPAVLA